MFVIERLKELREAKGLTQLNLGIKLNIAQETISGYETGRTEPDIQKLILFADFFGVSIDYILERTDVKRIIHETDLTAKEAELIVIFRELSHERKDLLIGMLNGLKK